MGAMVAKQPNGLLCRYSSIIEDITDYNMTEERYIELCVERAAERAREEARRVLDYHLRPFEEVVEQMESSIELGHSELNKKEWEKALESMSTPVEQLVEQFAAENKEFVEQLIAENKEG